MSNSTTKRNIPAKLDGILPRVQKPAQYIGGEIHSVVKSPSEGLLRFAFCFPDTYEIGMSHLGMKILYHLLNDQPTIWCERVFAPWVDMEEQLRRHEIPLYALESFSPLCEFDIIGFTLQYELSYTNLLNMLHLGGVPLRGSDRKGLKNLVIVGGPCACNPEPLADFVDLCVLGEGEEVTLELCDCYQHAKQQGFSKQTFLLHASQIPGIYVPSLYDVTYHADGTVATISPRAVGEITPPFPIKKRHIKDLTASYFPDRFIVPALQTVHDRAVVELMRGCFRGCRFCQAGYLYRPIRERDPASVAAQGKALCEHTGYEDISLSSLSTSDYAGLEPLLDELLPYTASRHISLSLPSLRIDQFSDELLEKISTVRKTGLTFAPEAGSQRMRDVINKNITEEEIFSTCKTAFAGGYASVKLYFMLGLPFETMRDCEEIIELAQKLVGLYRQSAPPQKGKPLNITVSTAVFVPKPFTPFQWFGQDPLDLIEEKQLQMKKKISSRKISFKYHASQTSRLEAVFARGDRRLGAVLEEAARLGCRFDGWDEQFSFVRWQEAFERHHLSMDFYANRHRPLTEVLPWSHLDYGVTSSFLQAEWKRAEQISQAAPDPVSPAKP